MSTVMGSLLAAVPLVSAQDANNVEWAAFKERFGQSFPTEEEDRRFTIFQENLEEARRIQALNPQASFGVTKFSALTKEEFQAYKGYQGEDSHADVPPVFTEEELRGTPSSVDWREKGVVASIKDQGQCGSCWAFSSASTIESAWAIAGHPLTPLSEQELVSCIAVTPPGGQCHGGLPSLTFDWLVKQRSGDVLTESFYPYTSHDFWSPPCDHVCRDAADPGNDQWCSTSCYCLTPLCPADTCDCTSDGKNVGATISSWRTLPSDEAQIKSWVATHGPISIGVDSMSAWQHYKGGIVTDCAAGMNDHAVNIVGFGEEDGTAYWIIRNSWNADWGEDGYMRVEYGSNQCNLKNEPTTVIVGGGSASISV
jgi:hypothetical protein